MASFPIVNAAGQQVGTYEFDPAELAPSINKQLLHDAVVMYQTNERQGSVRTKSRAEVIGSKKKLFKQKGTGRARMGNKRTGIRRGGGHIHAKRPIDWRFRMNRRALQLATRMALRSKFDDGQAIVLDDLAMSKPRTKDIVVLLKALGAAEGSCLLAVAKYDPTIVLSVRNLPGAEVLPARDLNTYALLRKKRLVVTKAALDALRENARAKTQSPAQTA